MQILHGKSFYIMRMQSLLLCSKKNKCVIQLMGFNIGDGDKDGMIILLSA